MDHMTLKYRDKVVAFSDEIVTARCLLSKLEKQNEAERERLLPLEDSLSAARHRFFSLEGAMRTLLQIGPDGLLEIEPSGTDTVTADNISAVRDEFSRRRFSKESVTDAI